MILYIELAHELTLQFQILDTALARMWLDRMALRDQYPLDHPGRFYGFNSREQEQDRALSKINNTIEIINSYQHIVDRKLSTLKDQDTLNYLHSIFERYHGLLDHQDQEFFVTAPAEIKRALAELNVDVHRCESTARGNQPRFVCTWYGLPKTEILSTELIEQYGTLNPKFGSVCLNYCEIGKTLEDLTQDRDNYISDKAFRPFGWYSADFNVRLHEDTAARVTEKIFKMQQYYLEHQTFFYNRGYETFQDPRLLPYRFPVAELIETMSRDRLLIEIQKRQLVTQVYIK